MDNLKNVYCNLTCIMKESEITTWQCVGEIRCVIPRVDDGQRHSKHPAPESTDARFALAHVQNPSTPIVNS